MAEADALTPEVEMADAFLGELRRRSDDPPGVTRPSYGPAESLAHAMAADRARALDLEIGHDFAGNQYMTLPGADRAAPAILIGSHLDSVPHGGNYDGAAGVAMGLAALARLRRAGRRLSQDVTVMAIRAEESAWFATHYIGSRAALGTLPAAALDAQRRADTGRTLGEHMREAGFDPDAVRAGRRHLHRERIRCYLEPHIEQGPVLIEAGIPFGVVTGIRGNIRWKNARATGAYAHSGAVPRSHRRDAVFALTELAAQLEARWLREEAAGHDMVCSIGEVATDPEQHSITKVAGEVRFTIDVRSEDQSLLERVGAWLQTEAARIGAARRVAVDLGPATNAPPAVMDADLRALLEAAAAGLGIAQLSLPSGAGHDCAAFAHAGVPAAMLFIRNANTSHNPDEAMEIADFARAQAVLDATLDRLG